MKRKGKNSMKTIVRYIRDFSIVVAGIAVTLYVNYKVTHQSEKRDVALYLNAIKMELEENLKIVDDAIEELHPSIKYANYIKSHDLKSLNKDTINSYGSIYYSAPLYSFKTNAFEMFKTSGTMRLVDDKELLLSLWDVYNGLDQLKWVLDFCLQMKWDDIKKELELQVEGEKMKKAPMYMFYFTGMYNNMLKPCKENSKLLKEMIAKLETQK